MRVLSFGHHRPRLIVVDIFTTCSKNGPWKRDHFCTYFRWLFITIIKSGLGSVHLPFRRKPGGIKNWKCRSFFICLSFAEEICFRAWGLTVKCYMNGTPIAENCFYLNGKFGRLRRLKALNNALYSFKSNHLQKNRSQPTQYGRALFKIALIWAGTNWQLGYLSLTQYIATVCTIVPPSTRFWSIILGVCLRITFPYVGWSFTVWIILTSVDQVLCR